MQDTFLLFFTRHLPIDEITLAHKANAAAFRLRLERNCRELVLLKEFRRKKFNDLGKAIRLEAAGKTNDVSVLKLTTRDKRFYEREKEILQ